MKKSPRHSMPPLKFVVGHSICRCLNIMLRFRSTATHANADTLSCLPLPVEPTVSKLPPEFVLLTEHLSDSPVTACQYTSWYPSMAKIAQFVQQGWPSSCLDVELRPFFERKSELSPFLCYKERQSFRRFRYLETEALHSTIATFKILYPAHCTVYMRMRYAPATWEGAWY